MSTDLINGAPGENISVHDRGFQYGDGLFETMAVANGTPLLWDRHMSRLFHGAARLGLRAPAESVLRREAEQICRGADRAVLKIIITRGISGRGYAPSAEAPPTRAVSLSPWPDYPSHYRTHGVSMRFCRTMIARNPALAGLKHLNRLEQVLARLELGKECAEGLMSDEQGNVIAGTMTNVFIVAGGMLCTPDLTRCGVGGIVRGLVIEKAAALSIHCRETAITRNDILSADEIFLTNSLIGLWPVQRIESKEYPLGTVTKRIQEAIGDAHGAD